MTEPHKHLGVFTLTLLTVAAIMNLRNLPMMAQQGFGSILFYLIAALTYFIPAALICSECASREGGTGGLYGWVKQAFGPSWGFMAMWMAFILNIAYLPTALAYLASTIGQMFGATIWINDPLMLLGAMLVLLWGITFLNYLGLENSARINRWALLLGTLIPGALMIGLCVYWVGSGQPMQITWESKAWVPDLKLDNMVFLLGVMLAFQGVEVGGYHSQYIINPKKTFARSMLLSVIILLTLSIMGSLSIAAVLPKDEINLIQGIMQVLSTYFALFDLPLGKWVIGTCIFLGGMATLSTWIVGPTKGMQIAAEEGLLPKRFSRQNDNGVPLSLVNWQSGMVSVLMVVGTFSLSNVEGMYWYLTILATQFALIAYSILFVAAIYLKIQHRKIASEGFEIPGGAWGTGIVGGIGLVTCTIGFFLGFVPPGILSIDTTTFVTDLLIGMVLLLCPGLWFSIRYARKTSPAA